MFVGTALYGAKTGNLEPLLMYLHGPSRPKRKKPRVSRNASKIRKIVKPKAL
jgi:hypothetical protein